jgi:hypothetical protein
MIGYDINKELVNHCNDVAKKYNYENIHFVEGDVSKLTSSKEHIDAIITLHACDTATDYTLYFAIKNKINHIFSVPCCQHELNSQIRTNSEFSLLLSHGLYKERLSAILTDAIRCEVLKDMGYDIDVIKPLSRGRLLGLR